MHKYEAQGGGCQMEPSYPPGKTTLKKPSVIRVKKDYTQKNILYQDIFKDMIVIVYSV